MEGKEEKEKEKEENCDMINVHIICRMLEIIDSYEAKVDDLKEELELLR